MSRSSDFRGDDNNNRQTDRLLYPCACVRGNDQHKATVTIITRLIGHWRVKVIL